MRLNPRDCRVLEKIADDYLRNHGFNADGTERCKGEKPKRDFRFVHVISTPTGGKTGYSLTRKRK